MPTDIKKIHQLYKIKMNKLDSNSNFDLPPAFIDLLLWESLNEYIDVFYSGSDKQLKLGFETTQHRMDLLKDFVVGFPNQPLVNPAGASVNRDGFKLTIFNLNGLIYKYKHFVKGNVINDCNNYLRIELTKNDPVDNKLNDSFQSPSSVWKRCLGLIEGNSLKVFSDKELTKLEITYIKIPNKPFFGGYDTLEYIKGDNTAPNSTSTPVDVELDDSYSNILTDLMVINTSSYLGDYNKSQQIQNKIKTNN